MNAPEPRVAPAAAASARPQQAARDLARRWPIALSIWGPPVVALFALGGQEGWPRTAVWTLAPAWMGLGCLWNALRCGRRHCYVTGPYFLLLAVVAALHGTGVVPLGANGWLGIGVALGAGGVLLTVVPEWLWGRYISNASR